ncbi:MAG TPA: hypothetical protein VN721_12550 [Flavipsychrobacter sp.]|nr:hypothetical protein [Flavipsychrobacter sp.]
MNFAIQVYIGVFVLVITFIFGASRFKFFDGPTKILLLLICIEIINEIIAFFFAKEYNNNYPVYNIYSLIELFIISLYFNFSIDLFRKWNIGVYIGIIGIIVGLINLHYLQSIKTFNSYFLLFEAFCIIGMALFAFFRLLLKHEQLVLLQYPHFWFITFLLLFWSVTFLLWGCYKILIDKLGSGMWMVNMGLWIVNLIMYAGIGVVFLLYPKMKKINE